MNPGLSRLATFHLLGERSVVAPQEAVQKGLQPALLGGFHNLAGLRYDFPLVLVTEGSDNEAVKSLADIIDGVLREVALRDNAGEQMRRQVLSLEQELRTQVACGNTGSLAELWDAAQDKLLAAAGEQVRQELQGNLAVARAAMRYAGRLVGCDEQFPVSLMSHAWSAARKVADRQLRNRIDYLGHKLADILQVDLLHTEKAHDARHLENSMGTSDQVLFDFQAMAEVLGTAPVGDPMPPNRRSRIGHAIAVLESQRFVSSKLNSGQAPGGKPVFRFEFDSCTKALAAFRKRLPDMAELISAISIAELEIANRYDEAQHDRFYSGFKPESLSPEDIALFPSYLVCLAAGAGSAAQPGLPLEIIGSGLPFKIVVQSNDLLEELPLDAGALSFGSRGSQLANMALGLNGVFVLQAGSASLYRVRHALLRGLTSSGPALFSIFTGANRDGVEPYLKAAAATESRAFPCFVFDPGAGQDWASRFSLEGNPQAACDWPSHSFQYEGSENQGHSENLKFTHLDFVAGDSRYAGHLASVPREEWHEDMVPVDTFLEMGDVAGTNIVPYVWLIDEGNCLQRAVVDQRLIDGARRCRDQWRSLQELGGIHNSHARLSLTNATQVWQQEKEQLLAAKPPANPAAQPAVAISDAAQVVVTTQTPVVVPPVSASAIDPDEPWIESIRCTSCNECTGINNRMFAYDDDQRAYIADPDAGTYRQMVEAAETCQVCIIHPGKPRNPDEPGLEELTRRAAPFK